MEKLSKKEKKEKVKKEKMIKKPVPGGAECGCEVCARIYGSRMAHYRKTKEAYEKAEKFFEEKKLRSNKK